MSHPWYAATAKSVLAGTSTENHVAIATVHGSDTITSTSNVMKTLKIFQEIRVPSRQNVRVTKAWELFKRILDRAVQDEESYKRLMLVLASVNNSTDVNGVMEELRLNRQTSDNDNLTVSEVLSSTLPVLSALPALAPVRIRGRGKAAADVNLSSLQFKKTPTMRTCSHCRRPGHRLPRCPERQSAANSQDSVPQPAQRIDRDSNVFNGDSNPSGTGDLR